MDQSEASPTVVSVAPERVDAVDLAIGLPTVGDGAQLQAAVGIVQEAMSTHLAGLSAAILHVDAALPDEQVGRVDPVADGIRVMHERPAKMLSSKDGLEVWSEAVRTVLGAARTLQARVVIVLNSSMASMTPEWVRGLAQPVLKDGCAFVLPIYERGRYDGTLTQVFVAPLMRALFGHQFWYPMADEFGCSADVAEFLLAQDIWDTDLARQGLEFWLPVAVTGGAHLVTQSVLGPRVLSSGGTQPPLGSTVGRVAGSLFSIAERYESSWLDVRGSEPMAVLGTPPAPARRATSIDPERMLDGFRQGVRDLTPIWERILSPESLGDVLVLSELAASDFRLGDRLWARIVYDYLLAYRARVMYRSHIAQSLAPLYLGCTASLVLETRSGPDTAAVQATERMARVFEDEKPYLVDRWR